MPVNELTPEENPLVTVADEVATPEEPVKEVYTPEFPLDSLYRSEDFLHRVEAIRENSVIAQVLSKLYVRQPCIIETNPNAINYLGVSVDDPTKISYLTYSRSQAAGSSGQYDKIWGDKNYRYHASSGKVVRKLFSYIKSKESDFFNEFMEHLFEDNLVRKNYESLSPHLSLVDVFSEQDFDIFNNQFRMQGFKQTDGADVIIVNGHWIQEFYLESSYASLSGTLGNSCMRYPQCSSYLNIYVRNPSICSLAIILNSEGKLQARALVWTIGEQKYYDRIYSTSDLITDKMHAYFLTQGIPSCYGAYTRSTLDLAITADTANPDFNKRILLDFERYPYMDSFKYLNTCKTELTTKEPDDSYLLLNSTSGDYESHEETSCYTCGRSIHEDDGCFVDTSRDENAHETLCGDCAVYSDYYNTYITYSDAVEVYYGRHSSETYVLYDDATELYDGSYCVSDDAIELVDGRYAFRYDDDLVSYHTGENFILNDSAYDYVEHGGCYYTPEECAETKDGEMVPLMYLTEVDGVYWLTEEWEENQNLNLI